MINEQMEENPDGVMEPSDVVDVVVDLDAASRIGLPESIVAIEKPRPLGVAMTDEIARVLSRNEMEVFVQSNGLAKIDVGYVHEMMSRGIMVDTVGLTRLSKGQCLANGEWIAEAIRKMSAKLQTCSDPEAVAAIGKVISGLIGEMTKLVMAQTGIEKQSVDARPKPVLQRAPPPFRPGEVIGPVNVQVNIDNVKKEESKP